MSASGDLASSGLPTDVVNRVKGSKSLPIREKRRQLLGAAEKLAGMGSFEWDVAANQIVWSDGLYAIYGLAPDAFAASFEAFLERVHPDDRERVRATIQEAFRDEQPFTLEERIVRDDGEVRALRSKGEVVTDAEGVVVKIIGVCQDVTEAKRAEQLVAEWNRTLEQRVEERTQQLRLTNEKLEAALDQLKAMQEHMVAQARMATVGNLVAGIAHEVNTPLGAIKAATDIVDRCVDRLSPSLENGGVTGYLETLRANARAAASAGSRLAEITERLKAISQLDESPRARLNVHGAVEGILTLIRQQTEGRIRVRKDYGELPPIWCYPSQLSHAFMSVLLNACEAIRDEGEIGITTWTADGNVFVRIEDTGSGIPREKLETLFEIGFTTRGSKVRLRTGLFNAYNIVQKHRGAITVESEPGRGTSVTVRLPIDEPRGSERPSTD